MSIEIPEVGDRSSRLEGLSENGARRLAMRVSRRSFLGRLGRGMIAASLGAASGAMLLADSVIAHPLPGGCGGCSVTCNTLTGNNRCPNGTNPNGCWCITASPCANYKEWCDCTGDNYCQGNRRCINGNPSCYNHRFYSNTGDTHIACRRYRCVNQSACENIENPC